MQIHSGLIIASISLLLILIVAADGFRRRNKKAKFLDFDEADQALAEDFDSEDEFIEEYSMDSSTISHTEIDAPEIDDSEIDWDADDIEEDSERDEQQYQDQDNIQTTLEAAKTQTSKPAKRSQNIIVFHVMAKQGEIFHGYDLLQALLSSHLRFGEMEIFHRYREPNGRGDILFSLASAYEPGTFDIKNMASTSTAGLTLFMKYYGDDQDVEVFDLMVQTAKRLANELDGDVCDQSKKPLSQQYITMIRLEIQRRISELQEAEMADA